MNYEAYENDSVPLDPSSPFFLDHVTRYWWAASFAEGKAVLDCACGHGYGTYILSKFASSALGVDLNRRSLDAARRTFSSENLTFLEQDIHELDRLDRRFDLVTAFEVIEHIPADTTDSFLRSLAGSLKSDGRLVLSTPNHDVVTKCGVKVPEFHINNFLPTKLRAALRRHFGSVEMIGQFAKRSGLTGMLFDFDFFNIRHVLGRPARKFATLLRGNRGPASSACATPPSLDPKDLRIHYEAPPAQMKNYIFSPRHWRQAGLTIAVCSRPIRR